MWQYGGGPLRCHHGAGGPHLLSWSSMYPHLRNQPDLAKIWVDQVSLSMAKRGCGGVHYSNIRINNYSKKYQHTVFKVFILISNKKKKVWFIKNMGRSSFFFWPYEQDHFAYSNLSIIFIPGEGGLLLGTHFIFGVTEGGNFFSKSQRGGSILSFWAAKEGAKKFARSQQFLICYHKQSPYLKCFHYLCDWFCNRNFFSLSKRGDQNFSP